MTLSGNIWQVLAICMSSHAVAADIPVLFVHVGTLGTFDTRGTGVRPAESVVVVQSVCWTGAEQQQHRQRDNDEGAHDTGETIVLLFFPSTNSRLPATNQRLFLFFASFVYLVSTVSWGCLIECCFYSESMVVPSINIGTYSYWLHAAAVHK